MIVQVTALPRSGTAFITTMLNLCPHCEAVHELITTDRNWRNTVQIMADRPETGFVFADVGTYQFLPKASIGTSRKVYIRQDHVAARAKARAAFKFDPGPLDWLATSADEWAIHCIALVIPFEQLFEMQTLMKIWDWCLPGNPFPESKVRTLLSMNVQRMNPDVVFAKDALKGREDELWG